MPAAPKRLLGPESWAAARAAASAADGKQVRSAGDAPEPPVRRNPRPGLRRAPCAAADLHHAQIVYDSLAVVNYVPHQLMLQPANGEAERGKPITVPERR
jgi:hypothetical protein